MSKSYVISASEHTGYSIMPLWLDFLAFLGIKVCEEDKAKMLSCGRTGYVDGVPYTGSWSSGVSWNEHPLQYHPYGCGVHLCPACVERAVKRLASHAMYRWTSLFELARRPIAVDTIVFTMAKSAREVVGRAKALFQRVVFDTLNEYYEIGSDSELFVESAVQDFGSKDISGEQVVHCHVVLANLVLEKKMHLVKRTLVKVGELVSVNELNRWRKNMLAIFNRRMREAFPELGGDEAENIQRGWISEERRGLKIATAQLHHALNYNYRMSLQDIVKWMLHNGDVMLDGMHITWNSRYGTLSKSDRLDDARRARLVELLMGAELEAEKSGLKSALRFERVRGFGAASKRKVGRVLKALADVPPVRVFVYKPFSKFAKEHRHKCWVGHPNCYWDGESVKISREEAIAKFGHRLLLRGNFKERKWENELEQFERIRTR